MTLTPFPLRGITFSGNVCDYKDEQEEVCIATKPAFSIGEFLKKGYQNKISLKR